MSKSLIAVILRMLIPWLRQQDEGLLKILRKIAKAVLDATSLPEAASMAAESLEREDDDEASFEVESMNLSVPDPWEWAKRALRECRYPGAMISRPRDGSRNFISTDLAKAALDLARVENHVPMVTVDQQGRPLGFEGALAILAVKCLATLNNDPHHDGPMMLVAARDYLLHGGGDEQS